MYNPIYHTMYLSHLLFSDAFRYTCSISSTIYKEWSNASTKSFIIQIFYSVIFIIVSRLSLKQTILSWSFFWRSPPTIDERYSIKCIFRANNKTKYDSRLTILSMIMVMNNNIKPNETDTNITHSCSLCVFIMLWNSVVRFTLPL